MRCFVGGFLGLITAGAIFTFFIDTTTAAGEKGSVWKPVIPEPAFNELVKRSAKAIEELLGKAGEDEIKRAQVHGVIIAAYAQSAKADAGAVAATKGAGLELAKMVTFKDKLGEAKKLATDLAMLKVKTGGKSDPDWKTLVDEVIPIMDTYRTKSKGGEGIHADLQVNPRLKTALNGIEEKIRALAMKKLSDTNVQKAAKELELLGYREAAMGSLIHGYAPAKKVGTKDPQEWRELSLAMRDAAVALAQAAAKKDAEGIHSASTRLNSACNQCHTSFRGQ